MRRPVAIVGMGQLGRLFGQGLLVRGVPVVPFLRDGSLADLATMDPALVLVAVGERDLPVVLAALPPQVRDRVALLQNELLPIDWEAHSVVQPTVAIVWLEKKRGRATRVVRTTRVAGPHARTLVGALEALDLAARAIDARDLAFELARKNVYILVSNLAGIDVGGTTLELATTHRDLALRVLADVLAHQSARIGVELPRESLTELLLLDLKSDPDHVCAGRTAPARLARVLAQCDALGLEAPELRRIATLTRQPHSEPVSR